MKECKVIDWTFAKIRCHACWLESSFERNRSLQKGHTSQKPNLTRGGEFRTVAIWSNLFQVYCVSFDESAKDKSENFPRVFQQFSLLLGQLSKKRRAAIRPLDYRLRYSSLRSSLPPRTPVPRSLHLQLPFRYRG